METENPQYKKAFFVRSWGNEIIKGMAFTLSYIDYYEVKKAFFIKAGETLPKIVDANQVVYSQVNADELLKKEKSGLKNYYEKEIKECTEKLKNI